MSLYTNNIAQFYVLSVRRENQHLEISNFVTISQACGFCSMVQFKSTISVLNLRGLSDLYDLKILWGNAKILFFRFFRVKSNKVTTFHLKFWTLYFLYQPIRKIRHERIFEYLVPRTVAYLTKMNGVLRCHKFCQIKLIVISKLNLNIILCTF
jgi:hypothetical protein